MRALVALGLVAALGCGKGKGASSPGAISDPAARLTGVPAQAMMVGVVELGNPPFKSLGMFLDEKAAAEMTAELDAYLQKHLGVSVAKARTITVFGSPENGAALIPYVEGKLAGESSGDHMGTPLYAVLDELVAAQAEGMLVIGMKPSVIAALDVLAGRAPPLTRAVPRLAELFTQEAKGSTAAVLVSGPMLSMVTRKEGLEAGIVIARSTGLRATLIGKHETLQALSRELEAAIGMLEKQALQSPPPEDDVMARAAFILLSHHVRYFKRVAAPKITGDSLVIDVPMRLDELMGIYSFSGFAGILSAVAIPAFMKNARKAKTTDATMNVKRLYDAARAYAEAHPDRPFLKATAGPTPPLGSCCTQPKGMCAPDPALWAASPWKEIGFSVDDPTYYSFVYVSDGATFSASAFGDLDCDGELSTFEMVGSIAADGTVTGQGAFFKDKDLE